MIPLPRIIASFTLFSLLAACGLKGPLYLPPPEPDENQPAVQSVKPSGEAKAKLIPGKQSNSTPATGQTLAKSATGNQATSPKPQTPSSDKPAPEELPADK